MSRMSNLHAEIQDRDVFLTETHIIASDDDLGVEMAFLYAAHDWMDSNLSAEVHTQDVCDRFNEEPGPDAIVHAKGKLSMSIVDGKGRVWRFSAVTPDMSKLKPGLNCGLFRTARF